MPSPWVPTLTLPCVLFTVGYLAVSWTMGFVCVVEIICSLGGDEENVKKMTGRCEHCYSDLRLSRVEKCDQEPVYICNGCERVYLGHPIEMLIQFPAKAPQRRRPEKSEDMYVN